MGVNIMDFGKDYDETETGRGYYQALFKEFQ